MAKQNCSTYEIEHHSQIETVCIKASMGMVHLMLIQEEEAR